MKTLAQQIEGINQKAIKIIKDKLEANNGIIIIADRSELFEGNLTDDLIDLIDGVESIAPLINEPDGYDGWGDFYVLKITGPLHDVTVFGITENTEEAEFDLRSLSPYNAALIADFLTINK